MHEDREELVARMDGMLKKLEQSEKELKQIEADLVQIKKALSLHILDRHHGSGDAFN
jgi:hypothetical protein